MNGRHELCPLPMLEARLKNWRVHLKIPPIQEKEKHRQKPPQFVGSMLGFRGVYFFLSFLEC